MIRFSYSLLCISLLFVRLYSNPIEWGEIVASEQFEYTTKASMYTWFGYLDMFDSYAVDLHNQNGHEITFNVPMNIISNDEMSDKTFPLSRYMSVMRIYYAHQTDMELIWTLEGNSVPLLSIENENAVMAMTLTRILDLHSSETKIQNKNYLAQLYVATSICKHLLQQSNSKYALYLRMHRRIMLSEDIYYNFNKDNIKELIEKLLREHSGLFATPTVDNKQNNEIITTSLVKMYISESIVPFLNRILPVKLSGSKEQAIPIILHSEDTEYTVDNVLFQAKFVITERQYENSSALPLLKYAEGNELSTDAHAIVSKSLRILFCMDRDVPDHSRLSNIHGYGAFSSTYLECVTYQTPSVQQCFVVKTTLNIYNILIASLGLSLLPVLQVDVNTKQRDFDHPLQYFLRDSLTVQEGVDKAIAYERSLAYVDANQCHKSKTTTPPRVLILGLASGELHMFLLQHFPCLAVDSVEISEDQFHISQSVLGGLAYGVCSAERLNLSTQSLETVSLLDAEYTVSVNTAGRECRSKVYIADAWDYISYRGELNNLSSATAQITSKQDSAEKILYDLIVFDVYDTKATVWSGEVGNGESTPYVDRAASDHSLNNVRNLLIPGHGLAVFHLHKDRNFEYYYTRICEVFRHDQIVLLNVAENDHMVIAGRDVFRLPTHLGRNDASNHTNTDVKTSICADINGDAVSCDEGERNSLKIHPCEQPMEFAENAVELSEKYEFSRKVTLSARYSLNCQDKADYWVDF